MVLLGEKNKEGLLKQNMAGSEENEKILTEFIQKQMLVLGPNIALDTARKVVGLKLAEDGRAFGISGDFAMVLKALTHEFSGLSQAVTLKILEGLEAKYPQIKGL